ncbi:hypothetical protein Tco_0364019 [Tanacetum coccineum]
MLEIKQVNQYAQALSSIPAIVDRYIDNKLGEAINKAIQAHNLNCRKEAHDEKNAYIELIDTSMRALIKEEINTQLPQILPQAVSDFANPSTYEAAASLFEFELTKILIDKMEKNKSYDKADYRKKLYDTLVESYNIDKDIFDSYGEVFSLKRSRDDRDKDQDPLAGSDRGMKRRKSSKDAESSRDSSQLMQRSQVTQLMTRSANRSDLTRCYNDEQQQTRVTKDDWFKKPERPPTPDSDWNKRQHLMDTSFDFSAFVLNWLNIKDLTQEILVGLAFELLKGTCKSLTELEYYLEEYQRGRQIIPQDFFINNDLEYLKGRDLSRRYSTSVTKTKATTYEIKWIEDLKRLKFVERIRSCTSLEEGDFPRLRLQDIEDMLLLLVQQKLTNLIIDKWYALNVALLATKPATSTGSPSSTTIDQDAPSPSNSQTTPETQSPIIPNDVEEDNHDLDVAHMNNDLFFGILIPENNSEASSSLDVIPTIMHTATPNLEHVTK